MLLDSGFIWLLSTAFRKAEERLTIIYARFSVKIKPY